MSKKADRHAKEARDNKLVRAGLLTAHAIWPSGLQVMQRKESPEWDRPAPLLCHPTIAGSLRHGPQNIHFLCRKIQIAIPCFASTDAKEACDDDNLDVGVSLRKACVGKCLGAVSFRPTNPLFSNLFVGGNAPPCPRGAAARVCALHRKETVGVSLRKACVGKCLGAVSLRPTNSH